MTQIISPQIHVIPDPDSLSALFFFGFPASQFPRELFEIHGFSHAAGGTLYRHSGRVIGGDSDSPRVLVIRAGPGTLLEMTTSERNPDFSFPLRLEVGHDFKTEPASARRRPPLCLSIAMSIPSTRDDNSTPMTLADNDLLTTFAAKNMPLWLRAVLDAQLVYWKKHHAETYYQFTPWPVVGEEFARCVRAAPYWALARWKHDLFASQIVYCMRRSPAGAVAFAIERIPFANRKSLILRFASEALAHAPDKLTDGEILTCVERDPYAVLRYRCKFLPAIRAKMLSRVIPLVRMSPESIPRGLEADILESMALFPLVWLDHYKTFVTAMEAITNHLSIDPDGAALLDLHHRMDPAGRDAFFNFMAHRI
jgi:hypothetical protein